MLRLGELGDGRSSKLPTEEGTRIGIAVELRSGRQGEYRVVVYGEDAQRFILDNLEAVVATDVKKQYARREPALEDDAGDV